MCCYDWFSFSMYITMLISVRFNYYSFLLLFTVTLMSSFVMFNSIDYLSISDSFLFVFYLLLFELVMMFFILCNDLVLVFLNWELLGLLSYLLINYWTNKINCGIKAMLYNSLGDYSFLYLMSLSFTVLLMGYQVLMPMPLFTFLISFLYYSLFISSNLFILLFIISLLFILFTKSAQFPFSSWLLNAMNAPTPVSALLHSSTMVIASLYVGIISYEFIIDLLLSYSCFVFIVFIGPIITLSWAVIKATLINDIKTMIALSTMSQLSYMYVALLINPIMCLFHIIIHALFKSMLFILSGSIIHSATNYQSMYKMSFNDLFISVLLMMALFVLVLSMTKEIIIYSSIINYCIGMMGLMLVLGSLFTVVYSVKLIACLIQLY